MIYNFEKIYVIIVVAMGIYLVCTKPKSVVDGNRAIANYTAVLDSTINHQVFSIHLKDKGDQVPVEFSVVSYWLGKR